MHGLLAILFLIGIGVCVFFSYRQIEPGQQGVVTRLGRVVRTLEPGPHFVVAGLDRVRIFDTRVLGVPLESQPVLTKDGVQLIIQGTAYYRIEDTGRVISNMGRRYELEIRGLSESNLRKSLGQKTVAEILQGRVEASQAALDELNEQVHSNEFDWGISFSEIALTKFDIPQSLEDALARAAAATKDAEALDIRSAAEERFDGRVARAARQLDEVGPTGFMLRQLLGQMEMANNPNAPQFFWAPFEALKSSSIVGSAAGAASGATRQQTRTDEEGK